MHHIFLDIDYCYQYFQKLGNISQETLNHLLIPKMEYLQSLQICCII